MVIWFYGNTRYKLIPQNHIAMMVQKRKTSINIDPEVWNKWLHFVLDETGSSHKVSEELEKAIIFYMENRKKKT